MSAAAHNRTGQHGFTLTEMLAALAILMVGVTTLLASLSDSVSLRRGTDMRLAAAAAVDEVLHQVMQNGVGLKADAVSDLDLELLSKEPVFVEGVPGLRFEVTAVEDDTRPDLWLLKVTAVWMEQGEFLTEEFLRVVPRQLPLGVRVQRFRGENQNNPR